MYMRNFETTFQVYLVDLFSSIFNVLYFSNINNTSYRKNNVLRYGIYEANTIDVHEVKA